MAAVTTGRDTCYMRNRFLVLALFAAMLAPAITPAAAATSNINLTLRIDTGDGVAKRYTLLCSPTGGTHPNRKAACATLLKGGVKLLAPVPADAACTMIYGGPQTAVVTGRWSSKRISTTFNRADGCHIAKWEAAQALFKVPGMSYDMSTVQ